MKIFFPQLRRHAPAVLVIALTLGAAAAAAQTFVESTEVVVVEVPVQVIRDGEPVRGLSAADFEVFDGRDKQTLTGFEMVDLAELSPDAAATAELPSSARRHFLVLFDLTFSSPKALMGGRGAAKDLKGTGGELYEKTNDLGGAMQQMLRRTGVTYVLAFQPEKVGEPETFHRLRVEVKNQPRGTRVVHRPGWYAPKPYTARTALEKTMSAASQLLGGEEGGPIRTALLAAPFRVDAGRAYVPVLLEIDGSSLLAGMPGGTLPAEIYIYALDKEGAVHGYVAQTVGLDVAKVGAGLRQSGLKFFGHLDLAPGEYRLRTLVRNGATGATTVRSLPLSVPTFAEAGPVLLPPFFPEPTGKWLIVREAPRAGQREVPYPFLAAEEPYVPAAQPVLVPGQEARLSLVVYNLGAGSVRVRARVLGADGKEVAGGRIKLLEHRPGPPDRLQAAYDPPELPPGEYNLQVTLTDGSGASRTSSTRFVVGSGAPAGA